jgi:hypothetical protein
LKKWKFNIKNEKNVSSTEGEREAEKVGKEFRRAERTLAPMDEINGYMVRPGIGGQKGAYAVTNGVSFTINSHGGVGVRPITNIVFAF